ncbi:MAG: hypothetical protein FK734_03345 [Asgard group archaeon]|nr:hypothetical protein [Asgard group archaeon]
MKKEINRFLILTSLVFVLGFSLNSIDFTQGHGPSSLTLEYNFSSETLSATISHSVADVNTHYIYLVEIWKNEVLHDSFDYFNQPSNVFTYNYVINATNGDVLKVKASCIQGGSATESITVSDGSGPSANVSAFGISLGILFVLTFSAFILKYKKRKIKF